MIKAKLLVNLCWCSANRLVRMATPMVGVSISKSRFCVQNIVCAVSDARGNAIELLRHKLSEQKLVSESGHEQMPLTRLPCMPMIPLCG